jgi:threonine synthase
MKERGELPRGLRIVAVLTGNGLKDPDAAIRNAAEPVEIEGTWEALEEVLDR